MDSIASSEQYKIKFEYSNKNQDRQASSNICQSKAKVLLAESRAC